MFQWVRPIHLDDKECNLDPWIAAEARDYGINVEQFLQEEVIKTDSGGDSWEMAMRGHVPRSKTRINLDSNEGNNNEKK